MYTQPIFGIIPHQHMQHNAVCSQGCDQGCCTAQDICQCLPGYTGHNCSLLMSSCSGDPQLIDHGLMARYYSDATFTTYEFSRKSDVISHTWGSGMVILNLTLMFEMCSFLCISVFLFSVLCVCVSAMCVCVCDVCIYMCL